MTLSSSGPMHCYRDKVIETMRQTGLDMRDKYKETSKGNPQVQSLNVED